MCLSRSFDLYYGFVFISWWLKNKVSNRKIQYSNDKYVATYMQVNVNVTQIKKGKYCVVRKLGIYLCFFFFFTILKIGTLIEVESKSEDHLINIKQLFDVINV